MRRRHKKLLTADGWRVESQSSNDLLKRVRNAGRPLGEVARGQLFYGVKSGFNDAFIIDRSIRDQLVKADKRATEIIKPFLRGRDVKRWGSLASDTWLI